MKKMMLVIAGVILFGISSTSVRAEGFDAAYYAARYPDVVAELGTDPAAMLWHYQTYGINEHRFQNAQEEAAARPQEVTGEAPAAAPAPQAGGETYVDVDIANQTVTYYENGVVKLQTPCVTGKTSAGRGTPTGVYAITNEVPGKYLTGPTWKVWVDRWMPFNGNIGLHDANWRDAFGGDIYVRSGSHGCVNLPHDAAVALYDMVSVGTKVVVR
ncbi:L,D-transpeptidase [Butyrivibrio sp. MC2013]|uniref:L,D-transpeptidase n=1 Tax=Butyrivibrio sp. MC2013 TaxID=1280686 RepID=UPI0004054E62|nr:L,D-transpeptidase [Butyrivibrio sp. MC2013]